MLTNWRKMLTEVMNAHGDTMADVVAVNPVGIDLDKEFDDGFGATEGEPFYIWTKRRIYFSKEYDGAESVGSLPRRPTQKETPFHR
jgi:hypothetical protein